MYTPLRQNLLRPDDRPVSILNNACSDLYWLCRKVRQYWRPDAFFVRYEWPLLPLVDPNDSEYGEDATGLTILVENLHSYAEVIGVAEYNNSREWHQYGKHLSHAQQLKIVRLLVEELSQFDYPNLSLQCMFGYQYVRIVDVLEKLHARILLAIECATAMYPLARDQIIDPDFVPNTTKTLNELQGCCRVQYHTDITGDIHLSSMHKYSEILIKCRDSLQQLPDIALAHIDQKYPYTVKDATKGTSDQCDLNIMCDYYPGMYQRRMGRKTTLLRALAIIVASEPEGITRTELGLKVSATESQSGSIKGAPERGAGYKNQLVKEIGIPISRKIYMIEWDRVVPEAKEEILTLVRDISVAV